MKYSVKYPRTYDWYNGRWAELAHWCDATYGQKQWAWSHLSEEFLFKKPSDRTMFILKWK